MSEHPPDGGSGERFAVYVDDNFHPYDETERYLKGEYETYEEAVKAAKEIVERELKHNYKPGMTPTELYDQYKAFGEDPSIVPSPEDDRFSAWQYAEARCREICVEAPPESE